MIDFTLMQLDIPWQITFYYSCYYLLKAKQNFLFPYVSQGAQVNLISGPKIISGMSIVCFPLAKCINFIHSFHLFIWKPIKTQN